MSDFRLWFTTGIEHITDLQGYDHILFVILLVVAFPIRYWRRTLTLITLFTLGHSVSLALSALQIINLRQALVELLIALTIFSSAVFNLIKYKEENPSEVKLLYLVVPLFGIIHGLGFSYLLRSMLGHESNITLPLLYFNLGIEAGQVVIIAIISGLVAIATLLLKVPYRLIKLFISCAGILLTISMIINRGAALFFP